MSIKKPHKLIKKEKKATEYLHYNKPYYDLKKLLEHIDRKFNLNIFDQPLKELKKENQLLQFIEKEAMPYKGKKLLLPRDMLEPLKAILADVYANKKILTIKKKPEIALELIESKAKSNQFKTVIKRTKKQEFKKVEPYSKAKWLNRASEVVDSVYSHNKSLMFHRAVDTKASDCPDYYTKIKNPIDLTTIKVANMMQLKLKAQVYSNAEEFKDDMKLMFNNCIRYNGKSIL